MTSFPLYRDKFSLLTASIYTSCFLCLWHQQESHYHTAPALPMAGCSQFSTQGTEGKGQERLLKPLIFFFFPLNRRSAESSSSWTGWLYQGLGRVLQENGYVLHFFFIRLIKLKLKYLVNITLEGWRLW